MSEFKIGDRVYIIGSVDKSLDGTTGVIVRQTLDWPKWWSIKLADGDVASLHEAVLRHAIDETPGTAPATFKAGDLVCARLPGAPTMLVTCAVPLPSGETWCGWFDSRQGWNTDTFPTIALTLVVAPAVETTSTTLRTDAALAAARQILVVSENSAVRYQAARVIEALGGVL